VALGRPDLVTKLKDYGPPSMPVPAMVGASTSLAVKNLVPERRKIIAAIRNDVFDWMSGKNYSFIPSVSNKFMVDVKRPGQEVVQAMAAEKVYIGRVWPIWPTYVRVTVGSREDMEKFKMAFEKVMNA
jgi:histidinol-phosphate/aromatic aminotransferase/cobyric acid decarboxylase-like protein